LFKIWSRLTVKSQTQNNLNFFWQLQIRLSLCRVSMITRDDFLNVSGGGGAHKHTRRLLMNYLRYCHDPCSSIVYSRFHRLVSGDRSVCTTTRAWLCVRLFLLRNFRTGISGRDRSGCAFVCAAREGWCGEVWDFSGHPRISTGNFIRDILRPSSHYCTVRDCGDRWKWKRALKTHPNEPLILPRNHIHTNPWKLMYKNLIYRCAFVLTFTWEVWMWFPVPTGSKATDDGLDFLASEGTRFRV
jgi:hypothetical protein